MTKDILTGIAAILAVAVAFYGLSTWKRQLTGNKRFELAFDCLQKFRLLLHAIGEFRRPFSGARDLMDAYTDRLGVPPDPSNIDHMQTASHYFAENLWNAVWDAYSEYRSALLKTEIILDVSDIDVLSKRTIWDTLYALGNAWQTYDEEKRRVQPVPEPERPQWIDDLERSRAIRYASPGDAVEQELKAIYAFLNKNLRPHLKD